MKTILPAGVLKKFIFSFVIALSSTLAFSQGNGGGNGAGGNGGGGNSGGGGSTGGGGNGGGVTPNCEVSDISGPSELEGAGMISATYTVTSNGSHVWLLPEGSSVDVNGLNDSKNITVAFSPSFTEGTIGVHRQDGNSSNCDGIVKYMTVTRKVCNMTIDAGPDRKVYFGYAPKACATIEVSISNGTGPYSYAWSSGQTSSSVSLCPQASQTYSVTVTDAKGCQATDEVYICVTDVRCYAGRSGNQKVEMCNKRGRNICVSPNAVPGLTRAGAVLGNCYEQDICAGIAARLHQDVSDFSAPVNVAGYVLGISPNPFHNKLTIEYELEDASSSATYIVYNVVGQEITKGNLHTGENVIDTHSFDKGVYFVRIDDHGELIKIIKE